MYYFFCLATLEHQGQRVFYQTKRSLERSYGIGIPMPIRRSKERFFYYSLERMDKNEQYSASRGFQKRNQSGAS